MIVSSLIKLGMTTVLGILGRIATQEVLEWALFYVAGVIVKHTETPHDDAFLEALTKANDKAKTGI